MANKTDKLIKNTTMQNVKVTPIGTEIILPNYSVAKNNQFVTSAINYAAPVGTIIMFVTDDIQNKRPRDYLVCNGGLYSKTVYNKLYAVIANTFGQSGSDFNVPNFQEYIPFGAGGSYAVGTAYGNFTTDTGYANVSDGGHNHTTQSGTSIAAGTDIDSVTATDYASVSDSGHTHFAVPPILPVYFLIKYQ